MHVILKRLRRLWLWLHGYRADDVKCLSDQAEEIARELLLHTPEVQRKSRLRSIRDVNPALYALITLKYMDDIREECRLKEKYKPTKTITANEYCKEAR